jgi:hypothetical protein
MLHSNVRAWISALAGIFLLLAIAAIHAAPPASVAPQDQGFDSVQPLDLKVGLWEFAVHNSQIVPHTNVDTPDFEKSIEKLSAADRKEAVSRLQAATDRSREIAAKGTDGKRQSCVAANDVRTNELLKLNAQSSECKRTVTASSQKIVVHYACPVRPISPISEATTTMERIDSENFRVLMQTIQVGDHPSTTNSTLTAHWIREDCATPKTAKQVENDKRIAEAPIAAATERHGNDYVSAVTNRTDKVISAYTIFVVMWGSGSVRSHIYDSATLMDRPLKPHATIRESQRGIVVDVKPEAVIFVDGTTWGGPKEVEDMMQRRVTRLKTIKAIAASLCDLQKKGASGEQAAATLEANKKSAPNAGSQLQTAVQEKAYDDFITYLRRPRNGGAKTTVAQAIAAAQANATPLAADPVKDANGNLYTTKAETQMACRAVR